MRVLIVGGGGREHALAWAISRSPLVTEVLTAPGNPGTETLGRNLPLSVDDTASVVRAAERESVDLVVIGPEAPLAVGLGDALRDAGIPVVGPGAEAARLEGSKAFAKEIMHAAGVPTAAYETFDDLALAVRHIRRVGAPIVVKADGLAAGKGVVVAETEAAALEAARDMLDGGRFGGAGRRIVVEECLVGVEVSVIVLTDGTHVVPLASSQDHKRLLDGDRGPNTGGMGAISPSPHLSEAGLQAAIDTVVHPVLAELRRRNIDYRGFLYAGLMITDDGPRVLEFNCRLGDPETQPLLMRLADDIVPALVATAAGDLSGIELASKPESACCVVLASGGYPGPYERGHEIVGLREASDRELIQVFHAGTARTAGGGVVTSGGRVLGVTALGRSLEAAIHRAYEAAACISWPDHQLRRDIGRT